MRNGDSRYMSRECSGTHRTHDHCHVRYGSPGWIAPYAANTAHPHYVPASLWGGSPYWLGRGHVSWGDNRYLRTECSGLYQWQYSNCFIRYGARGWVAPFTAVNTQFPNYVPSNVWGGGSPYWMGQGHVVQGDVRYLSRECRGTPRYHSHCYIRHGSAGWVAPYTAVTSFTAPSYPNCKRTCALHRPHSRVSVSIRPLPLTHSLAVA